MKLLTIVRHAHAEKQDADHDDFERRLDKRGRAEAEQMAELAHGLGLRPDHVISSPAVRAISTAKEFARALGFPLHRIRHDDRVYLAERATLATILRAAPPGARHVLIVGHNPGLSHLHAWLAGEPRGVELATAALATLRGAIERWADLDGRLFEPLRLRWPGDDGPRH